MEKPTIYSAVERLTTTVSVARDVILPERCGRSLPARLLIIIVSTHEMNRYHWYK